MDKVEKSYNRDIKYDLLRIIFMCMVLGGHVLTQITGKLLNEYNTAWYINKILHGFFSICNPLFFMLSGKFNLNKKFNTKEDYKKYYISRIISLIIPFVLVSIFIYIYKYKSFDIGKFWMGLIEGKMIDGTHWFVYTLISIILLSPFFSKMFQNMNIEEKKIFLGVIVGTNLVISSFNIFNIMPKISFYAVGIVRWHIYYFAGYLIDDIFSNKKQYKKIYILAIIAFIVQFLLERYTVTYYKLSDPNILLTLKAFALYLILKEKINIKSIVVEKIVSFISKYSYIFFLIHVTVLSKVVSIFNLKKSLLSNILSGILIYIITFIITLILAIILEKIIIGPVQKLLKKLCERYC